MRKGIKILSMFLTLVMLMTSTSAFAYCWECENNIEGTYRNFKYCSDFFGKTAPVVICGYEGKSKNIKIPSKIKGHKVIGIEFQRHLSEDDKPDEHNLSVIESIYIPATVEYANISPLKNLKKVTIAKKNKHLKVSGKFILSKNGKKLFSVFYSAKYPKIPESVVTISNHAFAHSGVKKVTFGKNVKTIDAFAFEDCKRLKEVKFNKNLKSIGYAAFYYCVKLESVKIPNKVKKISERTFYGCKKLKSVDLGKVEEIEMVAFGECRKLSSVKFYKNVKTIADFAFAGCTSLEEINLPKKIESINRETFRRCKSLKSIEIPRNVKQIGSNAFERCKNLTEVKLNKKLEEINELAFYKCTSLKEITIPKSVKIIKECAFKYCESLTDIYIYNPELEFYIREEYQKEPEYGWEAIPSHVTIHGYKDSTAQKYAEEYGNKFVELD